MLGFAAQIYLKVEGLHCTQYIFPERAKERMVRIFFIIATWIEEDNDLSLPEETENNKLIM